MAINLSDPNMMEQILAEARKTLDAKAQEIADAASPPIDTGFLRSSVYVNSERVNTFDQTWASGEYGGKRGPQQRRRVYTPVPYSGPNMAIVGWAAVYAWYVEDVTSFMYSALMSAADGMEIR